MLRIHLQHITKRFGPERIVENFSHTFSQPERTAILGPNGSGKSTLLQMAAGYVMPGKGNIDFELDGETLDRDLQFQQVAFSAPYMELIEELTLGEFLDYHFRFKKPLLPVAEMPALIGLSAARHKVIAQFSSGMKQRVRLAQCIFADTPALLLDEPCSNLDEEGIALYNHLLQRFSAGRLLLLASNDPNEYRLCEQQIRMSDLKTPAV